MSHDAGGKSALSEMLGPTPTLVERLRTDVLWHQRRGNGTIARDCQEAADEIERLRGLVRQFMDFLEPMRFDRQSDDAKAIELDKAARKFLGA